MPWHSTHFLFPACYALKQHIPSIKDGQGDGPASSVEDEKQDCTQALSPYEVLKQNKTKQNLPSLGPGAF